VSASEAASCPFRLHANEAIYRRPAPTGRPCTSPRLPLCKFSHLKKIISLRRVREQHCVWVIRLAPERDTRPNPGRLLDQPQSRFQSRPHPLTANISITVAQAARATSLISTQSSHSNFKLGTQCMRKIFARFVPTAKQRKTLWLCEKVSEAKKTAWKAFE
jgi:hypothetical protein